MRLVWSLTLLLSVVVCACSSASGETFSFAIIADPHINGNRDHKARLEEAVDWIIKNKDRKDIELVFVLGDIGWGGHRKNRNLRIAKTILDRLNKTEIPYIPIIGDNEVQTRSEKEFHEVFASHYRLLSRTLDNWQKPPASVSGMTLQNFSFDYKDCHFVCPDFNSRKARDEGGDLHDFEGGSWPWFKNDIQKCRKPKKENIVIMTHIGLFRTGFDFADQFLFSADEMAKIKAFLRGYKQYVDSNYAGHLHTNWYMPVWSGSLAPLYHVRVTDETWSETQWPETSDPGLTVRWVHVDDSGPKITYRQHIEDISENGGASRHPTKSLSP